ncbi:hypothetical protein Tco_1172683 [Tanacetum coccineum]
MGPVHKMTVRKGIGPLPTHTSAVRHFAIMSSYRFVIQRHHNFQSDASSDSSLRHPYALRDRGINARVIVEAIDRDRQDMCSMTHSAILVSSYTTIEESREQGQRFGVIGSYCFDREDADLERIT